MPGVVQEGGGVGLELVDKRLVTVKLEDVAEGEAIEALLGKAFGFVEMVEKVEPGLSSIRRLVLGTALPPDMKPVDPAIPPETRFSYYAGEKTLVGDYGKPEYKVWDKLPPAPETMFDYYAPDKASTDYGKPVFEPLIRGLDRIETVSGRLSLENVLTRRLRMQNDFQIIDSTDRDLRFSYQNQVNYTHYLLWTFWQ